ncbi:MAG: LysE family translocator [Rubrivivax sp.]
MTWLPASPSLLGAFVAASLVLAVTPGPGVVFILARTLGQGRAAGLASVAGVALGNLANAAAAALGLAAALFAVSATAFTLVKWAGALNLIAVGVQLLRRRDRDALPASALPQVAERRLLRDGFVVALPNPKTTLFFAAFLPQFVDPAGWAPMQTVGLGALFVAIAATTDAGYVVLASRLAPALHASSQLRRWARPASGASFIVLGALALLARHPQG